MALDFKSFAAQVRVTDGAWGTQLQLRGLKPGMAPELLNVEHPEMVLAVAQSYVQVGSEVILTNTLGANRFMLSPHGLAGRAAELAEAGASISRKAAGDQAKVFGSIGPSGKIVMMQDVPEDELELAFAEQATALSHGGVDAIVLETFNELDELEIALRAVKEATNLPVVACMTFSSGPDKTASMMGDTPGELTRVAIEMEADAIGANCGLGPDNYIRVAHLLREAAALPIWIKANAGLPQIGLDGSTVFPMTPQQFATFAQPLVNAGATFIGGCCGTTPEHIAAVRRALTAGR